MRRKTIGIAVATVVVLAAGTVAAVVVIGNQPAGPECHVPTADGAGGLDVDAVQLQHASTINAVGIARGLPERARVIALATAFQESSLRNLPNGDRDSVGLFQQRPSQGWGTVKQISDPVYAAGKFYDALVQVPDWETGALTEIAQAVQISGFPDAYAKWEADATILADGLGGATEPALACRAGATESTAPAPTRDPLPGSTSATAGLGELLGAAAAEFGGIELVELSDPQTAVVQVTATNLTPQRAARAFAEWSVAHATGFAITDISVDARRYADHTWSAAETTLPAGQVRIAVG